MTENPVMKYVSVGEVKAKLSQYVEEAQSQVIVVLSHGRPAAAMVGLAGMSLEEVAGEDDGSLLALLERRAQSRGAQKTAQSRGGAKTGGREITSGTRTRRAR